MYMRTGKNGVRFTVFYIQKNLTKVIRLIFWAEKKEEDRI